MTAPASAPPWKTTASGLRRTFAWKTFPEALAFVLEVGALAEAAGHHPDIDIRYNKVTLTLMTHDAGAITEKDHALAAQILGITAEQVAQRARTLL